MATHYAFSLLLSSRFMKLRHALLFAFVGILPDLDVIFRVHRSLTHSLMISAVPFLLMYGVVKCTKLNRSLDSLVLLGLALYEIHVLMDLLIAPTPIMWPLINTSLTLSIEVYAMLYTQGVELTPRLALVNTPCDFSQRDLLGGTLLSTTGVIVTIIVISLLLAEYSLKRAPR